MPRCRTIPSPPAGGQEREVSVSPHDRERGARGARGPGSSREGAGETRMAPAIVITGMHRSGTSLLSSAFQLAGVNIGDRLIGRYHTNRRGHFEDIEFEEFHERVLRRVGKNHMTVTQADVREMTAGEVEEAKALVARSLRRPLWGWTRTATQSTSF